MPRPSDHARTDVRDEIERVLADAEVTICDYWSGDDPWTTTLGAVTNTRQLADLICRTLDDPVVVRPALRLILGGADAPA